MLMEPIEVLEQRTGRLVREARLGRDMSQAELARISNLSISTVRKLESGSGANLETFLRVLRTLDRLDVIDSLDEGFSEPSPMAKLRIAKKLSARRQRASRKAVQ